MKEKLSCEEDSINLHLGLCLIVSQHVYGKSIAGSTSLILGMAERIWAGKFGDKYDLVLKACLKCLFYFNYNIA